MSERDTEAGGQPPVDGEVRAETGAAADAEPVPVAAASSAEPAQAVAIRRIGRGPKVGAVAVLGLAALALAAAGFRAYLVRADEASRWSRAKLEDTEASWQAYAGWARELRGAGGLDALFALRLTPIEPHARTASVQALVARAEAAESREDWPVLCALLDAHPDSAGATRAREALRRRIDRAVASYGSVTAANETPPGMAGVVVAALRMLGDADPCGGGAVLRVRHEVSSGEAFDETVDDGRTVGEVLRSLLDEPRARAALEPVAPELTEATSGVLSARHASENEPAAVPLDVRVVSSFGSGERLLSPSGHELPGVTLSLRVEMGATDPVSGARRRSVSPLATHELPASFALELFRGEEPSDAEVYERMLDALYPRVGDRLRETLGIVPFEVVASPRSSECNDVPPLAPGRRVHGDTRTASDRHTGRCAPDMSEPEMGYVTDYEDFEETMLPQPERIYRLVVPTRSHVSVAVPRSDFLPVIYLRRGCGRASSEVACEATADQLDATLDPGVYYVFVDSAESGRGGDFELVASVHPVEEVARACRAAEELTLGEPVTGTARGADDVLQSECGGTGRADRLYSVTVPERSRLRCTANGVSATSVWARRDCGGAQVGCDVQGAEPSAELTALVDPGQLTVGVDGSMLGAAGDYTLVCEAVPPGGLDGVEADTCAAPGTLQPSEREAVLELDTFPAHDDLHASCGGAGAPDLVYRIDVEEESWLTARLEPTSFRGVLSLWDGCGTDALELACERYASRLSTQLSPGTYFLGVDGRSSGELGSGRLRVALGSLERLCAEAPSLHAGNDGQRTLAAREPSRVEGTCGGDRGREVAYRLDVDRRSRVVFRAEMSVPGALYVRRACAAASSEVACVERDDASGAAVVSTILDPGTYHVFADRRYPYGDDGTVELDVNVTPTGLPVRVEDPRAPTALRAP